MLVFIGDKEINMFVKHVGKVQVEDSYFQVVEKVKAGIINQNNQSMALCSYGKQKHKKAATHSDGTLRITGWKK